MSDGADGPETPSTSDSPSRQPPPEPTEPADDGRDKDRRPRLLPVWLLLGAAAVSGGAWAVTEHLGAGGPPPNEASVPLITASVESWKVRPDDPGGLEIPNQGTLIYETLTTADPEEAPERVLPPPEEPLSPPQPEADGTEEPASTVADTASQSAQAPAIEEQEPAAVDEAAPPDTVAPDPMLVEETPPAEPGVPESAPDGAPLPPTKPAATTSALVEITSLAVPEALELASAQETPPSELEEPSAPPSELEAPTAPSPLEEAARVPVPVFKPVRPVHDQPARASRAVAPGDHSGPRAGAVVVARLAVRSARRRRLQGPAGGALGDASPPSRRSAGRAQPADHAGRQRRQRHHLPASCRAPQRPGCSATGLRSAQGARVRLLRGPGLRLGVTAHAAPRAVILGCAGATLDAEERRFLSDADPAGFILFKRNCENPAQTRALVAALREAVGRPDAPVLIDQEGGRVARLGPPHWRVPAGAKAVRRVGRD